MPIWKIDRKRTRLAVWLPDPLTVAIWMLKSFVKEGAALVCGFAAERGALMLWNSWETRKASTRGSDLGTA